ncbi:MAG: hypothetical protein M0Q94_16380 [Candidatus Cloacimonetes bacterium]|nr:hypothetical protein [Candidatus Cloacimonadota bacterium]
MKDEDILSEIMSGDYNEQIAELKKKFPESEFPGLYPIRTLHYNINEIYNHYSSEVETDLQREVLRKFDSNLTYNYGDDKFCGPFVSYDGEKYHATFYENFNAFLWIYSYWMFLQYELTAQKQKNDPSDPLYITDRMIERARQLFSLGLQIRHGQHVDWNLELPNPNPTSHSVDSEAIYCLKTNEIWKVAVCYIMFHELAHVVHRDLESECVNPKLTEQEADNYAIDLMHCPNAPMTAFYTQIGVTLGTGFLLFFYANPRRLYSGNEGTHPDVTVRISNNRERLFNYFDETHKNDILWLQAIMYCNFCSLHDIKVDKKEFEYPIEAVEYYEALLDSIFAHD